MYLLTLTLPKLQFEISFTKLWLAAATRNFKWMQITLI